MTCRFSRKTSGVESLNAGSHPDDDGVLRLSCPGVGSFRTCHEPGEELHPGAVLGTLRVLNRHYAICVPEGSGGCVVESIGAGLHDVEYGTTLASLGSNGADSGGSSEQSSASAESAEELICSPIDGIFYACPEPGAPPFVAAGSRIRAGQVIGLIEVMKTFNPIRWQPDTKTEALVLRAEVQDQQEVSRGHVLLVLENSD